MKLCETFYNSAESFDKKTVNKVINDSKSKNKKHHIEFSKELVHLTRRHNLTHYDFDSLKIDIINPQVDLSKRIELARLIKYGVYNGADIKTNNLEKILFACKNH